jgi:hypothetical protein
MISGGAYGVYNYFTKTDPGAFEIKRLIASIIFGAGIGLVVAYGAIIANINPSDVEWWVLIAAQFGLYSGIQLYVNKFIDWVWVRVYGQKFLGNPIFSPQFVPGFTVKPSFIDIMSGETIALAVQVTPTYGDHRVIEVQVDWLDGTPTQAFIPVDGMAYIAHTYFYEREPKYTGHTYYPKFTIKTVDGVTKTFNTFTTGRSCAIGVEAR